MQYHSRRRCLSSFALLLASLFTLALTGCGSDHADKSAAEFGKFLTAKHLPDGTYTDNTASMQGNKAVVEYGSFAKPWTAEGPNYTVMITKYATAKDCANQTQTFKNNPDAIIDGVFAIIPANDSADKAALKKIKSAWNDFK